MVLEKWSKCGFQKTIFMLKIKHLKSNCKMLIHIEVVAAATLEFPKKLLINVVSNTENFIENCRIRT